MPALTEEELRESALRYVGRQGGTSLQLRRALERIVKRAGDEVDRATAATWVRELVKECVRLGYVDDTAYAENKAQSMRKRGASARKIRATLGAKGIAAESTDDALAGEAEDAELEAARHYVRRRRFGADADKRQRELAAMARAGFAYGVAMRALSAPEEDE